MADKMLKAALEYASLGWPIFPVRFDKTPYTKHAMLDATTDPAVINKWWQAWPGANIGLNAGEANFLVIDYDPGSNRDHADAAAGGLPKTKLIASTPRGGAHEYYTLDEGDPPVAPGTSVFSEKVDVRSFHSYVLLPPSATKDGAYEWTERGRPARRSERLLELCSKARGKSENRDTWLIDPDLADNINMARRWLRGEIKIGNSWCRPAVEGHGGDHATFAAAAMMKSCGLSEGTALEVLWEEFNVEPRDKGGYCDPPWEYEELAGKVKNGYEYNTSPPGNVTPAYHIAQVSGIFTPVKETAMGAGKELTWGRFRFVDRDALEVVQPPAWLIKNVLPENAYAILVGAPGSYKTFLAVDMALTVATGGGALRAEKWAGPWTGVARPGPVLYIAGEGRSGIKNRVRAWEKRHWGGELVKDFVLSDPVPHIHEAEAIEKFSEHALKLSSVGYYRLVVLDTVARAMQGESEGNVENATAFTHLVDELRRNLGEPTVLALQHTGHENIGRARGSSAFQGDPDTILLGQRTRELQVKLSMTKQKEWAEWEHPKWIGLDKVGLPDEADNEKRDSLAAISIEAPKEVPAGKPGATPQLSTRAMDPVVLATLKEAGPLMPLSHNKLAELIVSQHEVGSKSTVRRHLEKLMSAEYADCFVHPMYDPLMKIAGGTGGWRYCAQTEAKQRGFRSA